MKRVNAYWPSNALLTALQQAGWGPLAGRANHGLRATLVGLVSILDFRSAEGRKSAADVAAASGYSLNWTRQKLHELEELGVVEWNGGGVVAGKAVTGAFRVVKQALVELIEAARPMKVATDAARRAATLARVAHLRFVRNDRRRLRRSVHAPLTDSPSPLRGSSPGAPAGECAHGEPRGSRYCALCRAETRNR